MKNYKYLKNTLLNMNELGSMNESGSMDLVGLVFAGIIMFAMIFFGIGVSQSLHDGANLTVSDEMYTEYQTATDVSTQAFNFMAYIPYLVIITAVFGCLLLLTKLMK